MTNAEFAVLSLVLELPRHGYEIERIIEERGMREWTEIGFSSIYYLLTKLEKDGFIEGRAERQAGRGPARKVYYITTAGKDACGKETLEVLSTPHRCYAPILSGLANFSGVEINMAVDALKKYRDGLSERLAHIRGRREEQRPLPDLVDAMFDYSFTMIKAEKKWIERFINKLEEENGKN